MGLFILILASCTAALVHGQCRGKVDLVIAVPADSLVPFTEFDVFEARLIELLDHLAIGPNDFNVGFILYGKRPYDISWPQPSLTRQQVNTKATFAGRRSLYENFIGGGLDVAAAIDSMIWMLTKPPPGYGFNILRPGARKMGVIFVYGAANNSDEVKRSADLAKKKNILLYALGTNGTGREFPSIGYDNCRLFSMGSFEESLQYAISDLAKGICAEVDRSVRVTDGNCFPKAYPSIAAPSVVCQQHETVPDPSNCAYYYQCVFGKPLRRICGLDSIFDQTAGICKNKENVPCWTNNVITCPEPTGQFDHPTHCSKFINCHEGVAYVMDCPDGMWFNAYTSLCVTHVDTECPPNKHT